MPTRRFVVLYHQVGDSLNRTDEDHFDWMFEQECGTLQTWETIPLTRFDESATLETRRLSDHRIDYLNLEGPISGGRGQVTRVISGTHRLLADTEDRIRYVLIYHADGVELQAEVEFYRNLAFEPSLREVNCDDWRLRFSLGR